MEYFSKLNNMCQGCIIVLNIVNILFIDAVYFCRCVVLSVDE